MFKNLSLKHERTFYMYIALPFQTILLTSFIMPLYGVNALVQPINEIFSPQNVMSGWPGASAASFMFLATGCGGFLFKYVKSFFSSIRKLSLYLNVLFLIFFVLSAFSVWITCYWLFLVSFILIGMIISSLFTIAINYTVTWSKKFKRIGLQSGVVGLMFGVWGALYSFVAPLLIHKIGLVWLLFLTGVFLLVLSLLSSVFFFFPKEEPPSKKAEVTENKIVTFSLKNIMGAPNYWIFLLFFTLFLMPGFGFKVIVQVMTVKVFGISQILASIIAVIFLVVYGISRLIFGVLSDRLHLKRMYLLFSGVQCVTLLIVAITLPLLSGYILFVILMCIIGSTFAAGKCLWAPLFLRLYGPKNYLQVLAATLPAFGLAGFIGPMVLNLALRSNMALKATSYWFYGATAALAFCFLLIKVLHRFDYKAFQSNKGQRIYFIHREEDDLDNF